MKKLFTDKRVNEKVSFVINGFTDLCSPMHLIKDYLKLYFYNGILFCIFYTNL